MNDHVALLSDVHLGQGDTADLFDEDDALATLLESLAADPSLQRVVLLGDTVDLVAVRRSRQGRDAAADMLAAAWRAHPAVLQGLRATLRAGKVVTVVRGNHDVELARATVQAALARSLGVPDGGRFEVLPWQWHVPGLLLAEHGQQYHDINAFDHVLTPFASAGQGPVQHPFGAQLDRLRDGRHSWLVEVAAASLAAGREAVRMVSRRRHRSRSVYRRDVLPAYAMDINLPLDTVVALDRLSETAPHRVLVRLALQLLGAPQLYGGYLPAAADQVAELLGPHAPRFLVYGHTHAADARPLNSGTTYLNTGTWCSRGPRSGESSLSAATRTWVEVDLEDDPARAHARVLHWSGNGSAELLAEIDPAGSVRRATSTA
jgi:UDP-2,3-diacylglucosamine pyrophosphatase LpxH